MKYFVGKMTAGINKCSGYVPKSNERPKDSWFLLKLSSDTRALGRISVRPGIELAL